MGSFYELYIYICKCYHNSVSGPLNIKFNINKKTDLTFYLGKICHYFRCHYFRIVECLTSHFIDSGFIKACSRKTPTTTCESRLCWFLCIFLVLIYDALSIVLQTQIQSYPTVDWQLQKAKDLGGLDLLT